MKVSASAPAKIILFGEHAVVFGYPAIAVPLPDLRAEATVTPSAPGSGLKIIAADLDETMPVDIASEVVDNALTLTARLLMRQLAAPTPDLTVTVHSQIPMASGLGSGAAVSAALARALADALDQPVDNAELSALVYEVEKVHHGNPSGIDNTVVVYEQPVYFTRGSPVERLTIGAPFHLVIGDTGHGALTRVAVGAVRALFEADPDGTRPLLEAIGALVDKARARIESGRSDALGDLMNQNHALLQRLTVSSPELDRLVDAAHAAGALGAKLSGGGRGGNMIALVTADTREPVAEALRHAGAQHVFSALIR